MSVNGVGWMGTAAPKHPGQWDSGTAGQWDSESLNPTVPCPGQGHRTTGHGDMSSRDNATPIVIVIATTATTAQQHVGGVVDFKGAAAPIAQRAPSWVSEHTFCTTYSGSIAEISD